MTMPDHTRASRRRWRAALTCAAVGLTSAALTATVVAPAVATPHSRPATARPNEIALPAGFQPEGITVSHGTAYLGSRGDGDIYAVNLRTGRGRVISQGPGTASVGLKVARDRLYVAGGASGTGRVVSTRTGRTLASYPFTTAGSFVNDVVLARHAAWFTDSLQAQLYRVSYARKASKAKVTTTALTGDWVQTEGVNNANGIALAPDGRSLLVVQSNTGFLFRVDPRTGVARRVDLGSTLLTNGDGLLVQGRTLYAVQNRDNQIAVVRLNAHGTRGRLTDTLTTADLPAGARFDVPTTVAAYRGSLYLPNARFGIPDATTADYWITRVPR
ncbi:superoxide dismutase [uncultured Friedmanniella sp.]|uniref:superoxide dismutase n=1 Tax=uncultured Friedmanniella sp. TaxID=335381 RepID=UPI0035C95873